MTANRDDQMEIDIVDGRFVITVGVDLVCHAVMYGNEHSLIGQFKISDNDVYSKDILSELKAESEDGTNLIHTAFDAAALRAIENGSEGVDEVEP